MTLTLDMGTRIYVKTEKTADHHERKNHKLYNTRVAAFRLDRRSENPLVSAKSASRWFGDKRMNIAEKQFRDWLDSRDYSYFFLDQTPETFARFFRGVTKRPDFIVVINRVGLIAVDVKEKTPHEKGDFILDESDEVEKYLQFERLTRIPVWFAFGSTKDQYTNWMWIPLSKVMECPLKTARSQFNGKQFRAIPPRDCTVIQTQRDGISRIIE